MGVTNDAAGGEGRGCRRRKISRSPQIDAVEDGENGGGGGGGGGGVHVAAGWKSPCCSRIKACR